jgi:hypothetical protein
MRFALEILSLVVLIFFGLSTPYRDYVNEYVTAQVAPSRLAKMKAGAGPITPERLAVHQAQLTGAPLPYAAAATPTPRDNSWMWRQNVLDRPKNRR